MASWRSVGFGFVRPSSIQQPPSGDSLGHPTLGDSGCGGSSRPALSGRGGGEAHHHQPGGVRRCGYRLPGCRGIRDPGGVAPVSRPRPMATCDDLPCWCCGGPECYDAELTLADGSKVIAFSCLECARAARAMILLGPVA